MFKEFRDFVARGNVLDLAVAVIIGVAFGKIVTSLVDGILMPLVGLLLGKVDFASLFYDLSGQHPVSIADAKAKGLPVIAYGAFINEVLNFLIIAFVVFIIVRCVTHIRDKQEAEEPATKECPACLSTIAIKATRCAQCCIDLKA